MHDIINRLPPVTGANVDIFSYGDIKSFASPDDASGNLGKRTRRPQQGSNNSIFFYTLDYQDIFLIASKTIHLGDDFFLSYKGKDEGGNNE